MIRHTVTTAGKTRVTGRSRLLRVTRKIYLLGLVFSCLAAYSAQAQEDWWFDVEVILFKYEIGDNPPLEIFDHSVTLDEPVKQWPLFENWLLPDIRLLQGTLSPCEAVYEVYLDCRIERSFELFAPEPEPPNLLRHIQQLPLNYNGYAISYPTQAHFLPQSSVQLFDLYKEIRWDKSMTPLLHTVWRQPVAVGRDNAYAMRLQAGKNLTFVPPKGSEVDAGYSDEPLSGDVEEAFVQPSAEMVEQVLANLAQVDAGLDTTFIYRDQQSDSTLPINQNAVFEIDGYLKVFIRYINNIPYLHVDSELLFNTLEAGVIKPHQFKQRRRVISQQVHYFDHPYFGMIIELRRFRRQAPPELITP